MSGACVLFRILFVAYSVIYSCCKVPNLRIAAQKLPSFHGSRLLWALKDAKEDEKAEESKEKVPAFAAPSAAMRAGTKQGPLEDLGVVMSAEGRAKASAVAAAVERAQGLDAAKEGGWFVIV